MRSAWFSVFADIDFTFQSALSIVAIRDRAQMRLVVPFFAVILFLHQPISLIAEGE